MLLVHKEFAEPIQLGLKRVLEKSRATFPGLHVVVALNEYEKLMHQVHLYSLNESTRKWALESQGICNTLIDLYSTRLN